MQGTTHWKDRAIANSEAITDFWEVTKIYAGRAADWVLFFCLVANIIQILPGVVFFPLVANIIIGTQAITLDVAGFGLAGMADHARANGNKKAAGQASVTSWFLIGLMMITVTLITVGILWSEAKPVTDSADKALILVRVAATVWYGHVVHSLRRHGVRNTQQNGTVQTPDVVQLVNDLRAELNNLPSVILMQVQNEIVSSVAALRTEISAQIDSKIVAPEPLDYVAITASIMPEIDTKLSEIRAQLDLGQLASQVAALVQQSAQVVDGSSDNEVDDETPDQEDKLVDEKQPSLHLVSSDRSSTKRRQTTRQTVSNDVVKKVRRLVHKNATITSTELAQKCNISRSYAALIKRQILDEKPA